MQVVISQLYKEPKLVIEWTGLHFFSHVVQMESSFKMKVYSTAYWVQFVYTVITLYNTTAAFQKSDSKEEKVLTRNSFVEI